MSSISGSGTISLIGFGLRILYIFSLSVSSILGRYLKNSSLLSNTALALVPLTPPVVTMLIGSIFVLPKADLVRFSKSAKSSGLSSLEPKNHLI